MTEKKKRFLSLSVKPLFVLLLGLVLGVCMALLAESVGEAVIERCYLSEAAVLKRTNRAAQELQGYVRQNALTTRNTNALAQWGESRKDYYILLYRDQRQILEIGWWGADIAAVDAYSLKEQGAEVVYPIAFRDGTVYAVIYDNSDSRLYDVTWVVSLLLGCAVLALTLLAYNRRVARKVVAISHEVQSIGEGNLYLQLEPKGSDELAQLTASVEQMRLSLLRKTSEEQRALQQNSDLITAMSHDIRNPLTALLGYLDLAKTGQYRTQEELQSYLDAAYGKAEQLKRLTDELFRYSLLFGCKELPLQLERYDASILLGQLLGESRAQLQQQGFTVQLLLPQQDVQIEADVTYLKRVFDNLFDNIRKYADPARPVAIAALLEDGALHVCLSNSVNPGAGRIESNKIGHLREDHGADVRQLQALYRKREVHRRDRPSHPARRGSGWQFLKISEFCNAGLFFASLIWYDTGSKIGRCYHMTVQHIVSE